MDRFSLMKLRAKLRVNERGATTLEYIVLAAVLVLGLVGAVQYFQNRASDALETEGDNILDVAEGNYDSVGDKYDD